MSCIDRLAISGLSIAGMTYKVISGYSEKGGLQNVSGNQRQHATRQDDAVERLQVVGISRSSKPDTNQMGGAILLIPHFQTLTYSGLVEL